MEASRDLEAAAEFEAATKSQPDDYNAAFNAGVAYRQAGRMVKAEEFYRKAADIRPKVSFSIETQFSHKISCMKNSAVQVLILGEQIFASAYTYTSTVIFTLSILSFCFASIIDLLVE